MKYVITSRQHSILMEQETGFTRRLDRVYSDPDKASKANKEIRDFYNEYKHEINTIGSIAFSLIPIVGPVISTAIALVDAKQYYDEGDKKTAGLVGMFSVIPLVGPLISKIPGVKELGVKGMAALASKVSKGVKLTPNEQNIVKLISNNQKLVQTEVSKVSQELAKKTVKQKVKSAVVKTGKTVAPYAAAGYGYDKTYDYVQKNTPKTKSEKEGLNWNFVKETFGSSGTAEDNKLLNKAWDSGWRPGQVVPQQFQTKSYQEKYNEEEQERKEAEAALALLK